MNLVRSPDKVDLVCRAVQPVIEEVNREEGDQMHPPRTLGSEYGIMVVDPALDDEIQGRNKHSLDDQVGEDAMAHTVLNRTIFSRKSTK